MKRSSALYLTRGALIAALYVALTYVAALATSLLTLLRLLLLMNGGRRRR